MPGGVSFIDYIPDGVRLATVYAGSDGAYQQEVQIPADTPDGAKQIVVTALDPSGHYAYLPSDLTVTGPAARASLSSSTLRPETRVRISGVRFLRGSSVYLLLYPEGVLLGTVTATPGGTFSKLVRMPTDLLGGPHGVVVVGFAAGGGLAYLALQATATSDLGGGGSVLPLTSTTKPMVTASTSSTTVPDFALWSSAGVDPKAIAWIMLIVCALLLGFLGGTWLRTPDGRRWRRYRRSRRGGHTTD